MGELQAELKAYLDRLTLFLIDLLQSGGITAEQYDAIVDDTNSQIDKGMPLTQLPYYRESKTYAETWNLTTKLRQPPVAPPASVSPPISPPLNPEYLTIPSGMTADQVEAFYAQKYNQEVSPLLSKFGVSTIAGLAELTAKADDAKAAYNQIVKISDRNAQEFNHAMAQANVETMNKGLPEQAQGQYEYDLRNWMANNPPTQQNVNVLKLGDVSKLAPQTQSYYRNWLESGQAYREPSANLLEAQRKAQVSATFPREDYAAAIRKNTGMTPFEKQYALSNLSNVANEYLASNPNAQEQWWQDVNAPTAQSENEKRAMYLRETAIPNLAQPAQDYNTFAGMPTGDVERRDAMTQAVEELTSLNQQIANYKGEAPAPIDPLLGHLKAYDWFKDYGMLMPNERGGTRQTTLSPRLRFLGI